VWGSGYTKGELFYRAIVEEMLDYVLAHPRAASVVGDVEAAGTRALLDACATGYRPHQIVALGEPGVEPATVPVLEGRATAYTRPPGHLSCSLPVFLYASQSGLVKHLT
jgi:hypothetical protein